MSNSYSCVPPSLIRQYLYCPAAAYYIITRQQEPPTERMAKGRQVEREAVEAVAKKLGASRVQHQVQLRGGGICGVVDAVLWIDDRPAPLEVKTTKKPPHIPLPHKAQAAAYAIAAQTTYKKAATAAYIHYAESGHTAKIPLTKDMADLVKHTATQILRIYKGWTPPPPPPTPKCQGCWYRKYCGYTTTQIEMI